MSKNSVKSFDLRLHEIALVAVAIGVPVSLIVAGFAWFANGVIATAMLKGTLFAVVAAYPVWRAYRKKVEADS